MTGSFPYVKYRPNDVSAWKAEMYDIFMSLDLEYAVDTDTDQLDHKIFCEDYLNKDPNTIKQSRSKRLFTKMQARCNTMLRLATSASQHRLMLGLGQNTYKIWNHLCKPRRTATNAAGLANSSLPCTPPRSQPAVDTKLSDPLLTRSS